MKKLILITLSLILFTSTIFWSACNKNDDPTIPNDEKEAYDHAINLQNEVNTNLDEWFSSMDSLEAINMAQQEFANDPGVTSAIISSQGISVQYTNGMRGGLFINPRDGGSTEKKIETLINGLQSVNSESLKSLVNKRKMVLLNPHYYEREYYTDQIINTGITDLERVGIQMFDAKNNGCSVDVFASLTDYGIIQIYSHGLAWPKEENITDVYLLTGETVNEATSNKYWDELKSGNIPIMKIGNNNKYFISERFISEYNDFSQDTILFYGGFCYSFLGDWPDIVESFADGTYFGFDWSVRTDYNAAWSQNLIELMSDTSKSEPMGPEAWMQDPSIEKSYIDPRDNNRTVHIYYTGDGTLKLWDKVSVKIIALSDDGTPVDNPGEAGIAYPFKCQVTGGGSELEYIWNIGDGSSPITTAENEVDISWSQNGSYQLSVIVKDKSSGQELAQDEVGVNIGTESITWSYVKFRLNYLPAHLKHIMPDGTVTYMDVNKDWHYDLFWKPGVYQNGTFTTTWDYNDGSWINKGSLSISIDEQTQKITGGMIHSELRSANNPDNRYFIIDFDINEISAYNWDITHGNFYLFGNDLCNTTLMTNISYEDSEPWGVSTVTNTLESYSCNENYTYFSLEFQTD